MKISLKTEDKVITATLIDNETTQDFVSLLPLKLTMREIWAFAESHFGRRQAYEDL